MINRFAVVLAAGQGTRMKSKLYKVLHPVCGKPMVEHVVDQLRLSQFTEIVTVVGFGAEKVKEQLGGKSQFVIQEQQLGTGHAVQMAAPLIKDKQGTTIVICGDTPLLTAETLNSLLQHHEESKAKATVLTACVEDPTGYGRIIRDENGLVERIVEQKDASEQEQSIQEINTGTYCFDNEALFSALEKVSNDNAQGEYYLPDVMGILRRQNEIISAYQTPHFEETIGVNDRVALSEAERIMRRRINRKHMKNGVTILDPENTYIDSDVQIGRDTIVHPGTIIKGNTVIGEDVEIGPHSEIRDCQIGNGTVIKQSVAHDSQIGERVQIGPFAHIRLETSIEDQARIGNFVEMKKTAFGKGSKASHLSYIGDAEIGESVNLGCGSITVNYDGKNKYKTVVEDHAFIGCNANLVAPVIIGKGAFVAAGSTINKNVPAEALSIARARQTNKEGYAAKIQQKKKD
ncbi:bifunctional UDP-N-acetylglucosamine diphosphorylase/glucosamine-1-phosphate N-acetyltransferase GlmU [Bacillaceae bacterium S4-13-58]